MDKIKKIKDWLKPYLEDRIRDEHEEGFFHCAMLLNDFIDTLSDEPDKSLEEAAEEYSKGIIDRENSFMCKAAFEAGAKWMAGQGVTLKVTDDTTWGEVNDFIHRNCDGVKEIQIRKK